MTASAIDSTFFSNAFNSFAKFLYVLFLMSTATSATRTQYTYVTVPTMQAALKEDGCDGLPKEIDMALMATQGTQ